MKLVHDSPHEDQKYEREGDDPRQMLIEIAVEARGGPENAEIVRLDDFGRWATVDGKPWHEVYPEMIARAFHETYERLAPQHGYETREASAKPWEEVPEQNRALMVAVVGELLSKWVIG